MNNIDSVITDQLKLDAAVQTFLAHVQQVFNASCTGAYPVTPAKVEATVGKKYIKFIKQETFGCGRSAYAFINRENGDILLPKSWAAPAKGARGNVYQEATYGCAGPFGVSYLR